MNTISDSHLPLPAGSVIICSRNRPELLLETVQGVLRGADQPGELVIIDQSDAPNLALMNVKSACDVRYLHSGSIGASRARNEGVAAARYNRLAFIDDDITVSPDWYRCIITALEREGEGAIITGRILAGQAEKPGGFVPALVLHEEPCTYRGRSNKDPLVTCNMAMFRSAFETVGGLDERLGPGTRFPAADDNDLGFRLLEAGYRIEYDPWVLVYHRAWRSEREFLPMRWSYGRAKGGFYGKYVSLRDRYMFRRLVGDIVLRLVRFPWRVLHAPRLAFGDLIYSAGVISAFIEWRRTFGGKSQSLTTISHMAPGGALDLSQPSSGDTSSSST